MDLGSTRRSGPTQFTNQPLPTPPAEPSLDTAALVDSADADYQQYQDQRGVKILNRAGSTLSVIQTDVSQIGSFASPLQVVADTTPAKAIRQSIAALVDGIPTLLKVLDDISSVHPFIKIAVGAFRVAVELDLKRKDNDHKISLLFAEMRDMMAVLVQLGNIAKDKRAGDDNITIEERMDNLIKKTDQDIRKCANTCSAYSKKRTFTKVIQSSSWDDTFKGFIQGFTTRRGEFEFELSLYIGRAVNTANDKLLTIEEKLDRLTQYLQACVSPEERELMRFVEENHGAQAVMNDKTVLERMYNDKSMSGLMRSTERRAGGRHDTGNDFEELLKDLKVDTETAIRDNLEQFERKFIIQQRELEEEMRRTMHYEGDRIIKAVTSGPHERIIDPDIHVVWEEMNWRGNVKARHFVLALRDYFHEKLGQLKRTNTCATPVVSTRQLSEQDEWTLEYVNITRLQPIIEAFDDDASGFITVAEVNAFTTARPGDWSLLHWLAYWAVGFQMVISQYAEKIDIILAKMFSLKTQILPANRNTVEQYLNKVWTPITAMTSALRRTSCDESLMIKFESYFKGEEDRLRQNLETARYDFDARDTLELVCGPGSIEKHAFPLLYLLLSRDFEIMRLARSEVLHIDELFDAADTMIWVFEALYDRYVDLTDLFKQQRLDPNQQFKIFGYELFKYWHDESEFTSMKHLKESEFVERDYDDSKEAQDVDPGKILNYPLQNPEELFAPREFVETAEDAEADPHIRALIGHWSGFCMIGTRYPCQSMISLDIHVNPDDRTTFRSFGTAPIGTNWTIKGEFVVDPDNAQLVTYKLVRSYSARFSTQTFRGTLQPCGTELSGTWGYGESPAELPHKFVFKRLPCELMRFWPSPAEFETNRYRALWAFACAAVRMNVRRRLRSWSWLKQRWETGQRYAKLVVKSGDWGQQLSDEENQELTRCWRDMTADEARLYSLFMEMRRRNTALHDGVYCDFCQCAGIRGERHMCLSCGTRTTIDLCDKPECRSAQIERDDLTTPHLPSHDVFKVRVAVHAIREFGKMHRAAQSALKAARLALGDGSDSAQQVPDNDDSLQDRPKPSCVKCGSAVKEPCWYCAECDGPDGVFICVACDTKYGGFTSGKHKATHALVNVQPVAHAADPESEQTQLRTRMGTLEGSVKDLQTRIEQSALDGKTDLTQARLEMAKLEGKLSGMEDRLSRMEDLLLSIGAHIGAGDRIHAGSTPREMMRQATWPGPVTQGSDFTPESEFSIWVRKLRQGPSSV